MGEYERAALLKELRDEVINGQRREYTQRHRSRSSRQGEGDAQGHGKLITQTGEGAALPGNRHSEAMEDKHNDST